MLIRPASWSVLKVGSRDAYRLDQEDEAYAHQDLTDIDVAGWKRHTVYGPIPSPIPTCFYEPGRDATET